LLAKDAARIAADPKEPVLADDRSSLFEMLVDYDRANGAGADATALARKWRDFLDGEAARAPTPLARSVFDSHRIGAYAAVGEPERAIPMLEQSERDFPDDYNPPARLAKVLLDVGRLDAALTAVRRAEAKVYGPRTLRVYWTEADIWMAMKKPAEAKTALTHAIALGEKLELQGGYQELYERMRSRASAL
jgi:tetratricopeptide (TPR) repeat protein